jgi:capsular polysaccharide biosynthesis protein
VNVPDHTIFPAVSAGPLPEQLWADDDPVAADEPSASEISGGFISGGFTSLGFIRAALRRSAPFWLATGLIGLLIGGGLYVKYPPAYQASTSVYITNNPDQDAVSAMQTNVTLAESRPVAQAVIQKLGLKQSVSSLIAAYTASVVTNQVLLIEVAAPSGSGAIQLAQTVAAEFLQFRADMLRQQQQLVLSALNAQITQAQKHLSSIEQQISQVSAETQTTAHQSTLNSLNAQRTNATNALATLRLTVTDNQASSETTTATMVQGSEVLNQATLNQHSRLRGAVEYVGAALFAGLVVGMAIVAVRALITDRLRRRDDVAEVLGAPVRLSVGKLRSRRGLTRLIGRGTSRGREAQRLTAYLRNALPTTSQGAAALAVVAVDNARSVAGPLVSLAASCARDGKKVVLADLSAGTAAARLLGVKKPGVHTVTAQNVPLVLAVPASDDVMPAGPLHLGAQRAPFAQADQAVVAACKSADLLLTLVTLDPALGGDHLTTWAFDAVVVVTAGQSSATRIQAVGEMVRLAGTESVSAVLIGADKRDESLGARLAPRAPGPSARA